MCMLLFLLDCIDGDEEIKTIHLSTPILKTGMVLRCKDNNARSRRTPERMLFLFI